MTDATTVDRYRVAPKQRTVTIILTNYNHSKYLETSIGGILGQTRPADEIIIIDDGSTDNSLDIINSYRRSHPDIRLLENVQNRGVQYTIARALGAATGDYVVWAAADDKLLPDFLAETMIAFDLAPEAGVAFSQLATFADADGKVTHYTGPNLSFSFYIGEQITYYDPDALMERLTHSYCWLSGNTAVARRDYLFEMGAFIPSLEWHSDWYAFYAVALRHGAVGIPKTLAMMRVVEGTYSATGMKSKKRQRRVMMAILDTIRRQEFSDIRRKIRARPCVLSPFVKPMIGALARRPRDWDILACVLRWALNHMARVYSGRIAATQGLVRLRLRILRKGVAIAARVVDAATPRHWKSASLP